MPKKVVGFGEVLAAVRPIGYNAFGDADEVVMLAGGEIDIPQLTEIFNCLLEVGYLNEENPGKLVLEIQPFPNRSPEETVTDNMRRLEKAWEIIRY